MNLAGNPIGSIPASISRFPNLYELDLSRTSMLAINYNGEVRNTNLEILKLDEMPKLQGINDCAFCNFFKLKKITFAYSPRLTFIHENAFGNVNPMFLAIKSKMKDLNFFHCSLTTLPEKLLDWTNVESLFLDFNHFACDCNMQWLIDDLSNKTR